MNYVTEPAGKIPVIAEADVAVVGGGTSGLMAAVAAARHGARTVLIERFGSLGGTLNMGIVHHIYNRFRNKRNQELIGGLPREALIELVKTGGTAFNESRAALGAHTIPFRPEYMGHVYLKLACGAGVKLMLQTRFVRVLMKDNVPGTMLVENKSGRQAVRAKMFIDASGDADLCAAAGAPTKAGGIPWGLMFTMCGVDDERFRAYLAGAPMECPEFISWLARHLQKTEEHIRNDSYWRQWERSDMMPSLGISKIRPKLIEAVEHGDLELEKDLGNGGCLRLGWDGFNLCDWGLPGEAIVNVCYVFGLDAGNGEDVTKAETAARLYAMEFSNFLRKYIPGFERARISQIGGQTISRNGRMIDGEYWMTREDVNSGKTYEDGVGICQGIPEKEDGKIHQLPFRMFLPREIENVLAIGKCAAGGGNVRGTAYCMLEGHICGIAAAVAARSNVSPRNLEMDSLKNALRQEGVIVDPPER